MAKAKAPVTVKQPPNLVQDALVAALEAELIRLEHWALEAMRKTRHRVNYIRQPAGVRPVYLLARMQRSIAAILKDPASTADAKRAGKIATCLPSLWKELTRTAAVSPAMAETIATLR
jgi:hypothetical protein